MSWLPKEKVVVPIDFSDESVAAASTALQLVESAGHLHAINVLPVLSPAEPGVVWDTLSDRSRCDHSEQALRQQFADANFAGINVKAVVGDPGHEIARHAESIGADLIVMPSHGRTGLKHLLIGSVAERVVRLAHCPVLVLRR